MLKRRLIPLQLLRDSRLVKSRQFDHYRDVGDPVKSAAVYSDQLADELIILNIESDKGIEPLLDIVTSLSEVCFMPLTLGGGIRCCDDAEQLIARGADRVFVNALCYENGDEVKAISNSLGAQSVVAGVDIDFCSKGNHYRLYRAGHAQPPEIAIRDHIEHIQACGVGEIMIQSVNRDGVMGGMDCQLMEMISEWTDLPLLMAGGVGDYNDIYTAFTTTLARGVICGSLFNFTDSNPIRARAYLMNNGVALKKV